MIEFISDCAGLFTDTFNAAMEVGVFLILGSYILIKTSFALFWMLHRGAQKM